MLLLLLLLSLSWLAGRASRPERLCRRCAHHCCLPHLKTPLHCLPVPPVAVSPARTAAQDEPDHQRELYAGILNQLLMNLLMCTAGK